jgi:type VI secretion system protein ImpH
MGTTHRLAADAVAFFDDLEAAPHRHDFYQALRRLECLWSESPRWGLARRPADEPVRLGHDAELTFAPAPLSSFTIRTGRRPRLGVRLFGLLGPNGPLPLHLTEYARERQRHAGDPTFLRFLDLLQHRFTLLLYRAWAQAQPHVNRDRPDDDRFQMFVGSFIGLGTTATRNRDGVPDVAKYFHAGMLVRHVRNASGLRAILAHDFRLPVEIDEWVGHWMPLGPRERTCLGRDGAVLGAGGVLGARVWDRQHNFRVRLGPLTFAEYESFLPGGASLERLVDWVRLYLGRELEWDLRLRLARAEVPRVTLGRQGRLGWTTWLGRRPSPTDADDLCFSADSFVTTSEATPRTSEQALPR